MSASRLVLLLAFGLMAIRAEAGVVEDWNHAFLNAVRKETPPPCLVSRNLAIFHLAMHEAVRDVRDRQFSEAAQEAACHLAAERVFKSLFPSQPLPSIQVSQTESSMVRAVAIANADEVLKSRENDGSTTTIHYVPSDKPGQWRRTPPANRPPEMPHWGSVKPFVLDDVVPFRAPAPPAFDSAEFAKQLAIVRDLGGKSSDQRTEDQTLAATFWSDFSYTESPPGHWNDIAAELTEKRKLPVEEAARLFATLNVAMADAGISCWETKYHFNFWRPITALAYVEPVLAWQPMLKTPPHPEYISGHGSFSGAAATVLKHFLGGDEVSFDVASDSLPGVKRHFTRLHACVEEICNSRVWGGIHYPMSGEQGRKLGERVAEACITRIGKR